jgi:hypothetical protein
MQQRNKEWTEDDCFDEWIFRKNKSRMHALISQRM